jgi:hypothetical protein
LAFLLYVVLFLHAGSPPSLAVGLAVAAVCFALSALTKSAVQLREENELTI